MFRRFPSKRALAAAAKLRGRRLEKRWPFLPRAEGKALNLTFDDVLEFQYARTRDFVFVVVGAFDGLANDPISHFIRTHDCRGVLLEPQPAAYERLCQNFRNFPRCTVVNRAIDEVSGSRPLYYVAAGSEGLPEWAEQIASFRLEHVRKHEARAPGLAAAIRTQIIPTISFDDLLDTFRLRSIDVLQIDAEGMDAQLLAWFPFQRLRPSVLHYETAHMTDAEHAAVRARLGQLGYAVREADEPTDDMAILL
ncbi:MAG TPA: FkbM family methyltransferase [Thermoanaerobaculia bacterium]|nr:FkbM family methyltransferase [Thermoanaerobaculia bacterium]